MRNYIKIGRKISLAKKGKTFTDAHKKALSDTAKRNPKKNLFKKGHSKSNTGRTHFKKGMTAWNKGMKMDYLKGKNHPNWKGGNSKGYKTGYYSAEYKEWRRRVFERDDYTCQECGEKGYITAHHIKSFAKYPKLRFEVSNGMTLCEDCHKKTDNYMGRANRKTE